MRVRDDWPGSLCMMALAGWLTFWGGIYLFSVGGHPSGETVAVAVVLASAPFIGIACVLFPSLYWRKRTGMPKLSRAVIVLGVVLIVVGSWSWYAVMASMDEAAKARDEHAEMERLQADFEKRKTDLLRARQECCRSPASA